MSKQRSSTFDGGGNQISRFSKSRASHQQKLVMHYGNGAGSFVLPGDLRYTHIKLPPAPILLTE